MTVISSGTCPSPYPLPAPVQAGLVQRAGRGMKGEGACAFYATLGLTDPISREQSFPIHLEQRRLNCSVPIFVVGLGFLSRECRAKIDLASLSLRIPDSAPWIGEPWKLSEPKRPPSPRPSPPGEGEKCAGMTRAGTAVFPRRLEC